MFLKAGNFSLNNGDLLSMQKNRIALRLSAALAACTAVTLMVSGVSYAHVEPDPIAVEAGKSATVGFAPGHGCDGSPTISLAFKVPATVTDAVPVDKAGWTGEAKDGVVTFSGGSVDATVDTERFEITFTAPAEAGPIYFPVVQTCVKGAISWIDPPNADGSEAEFASPAVMVTAGPPTSADLIPAEEEETMDTMVATETSTADTVAATTSDSTAVSILTAAGGSSDSDSSNTGLIVAIIAAGVVVVGGGAFAASRRKK
jgi:uncharacterized protein YcnI